MVLNHAEHLSDEVIAERNKKGMKTTYYVCTYPRKPNTFTNSPPMEAVWLGHYVAKRRLSGFLRWAYNSWVAAPELDSNHVTWQPGDCFLVYPLENGEVRSAVRFEMLREGIEDLKKLIFLETRL